MREKLLWVQAMIYGQEDLSKHAAFVSNLFTHNLPPVSIKKTQKFIIEFCHESDALFIFPKEIGESIYTIRETLNFNTLLDKNNFDKTKIIAEAVYNCLKLLYNHVSLGLDGLELGYKKIIKSNYTLSLNLCGGIKHNKSNTTKAVITADYFLEYVLISVSFLDQFDKIVKTVNLFNTLPHQSIYSQLVKTVKWINNNVFQLSNNTNEIKISINLDGSVLVRYFPKGRDTEGIKEQIKLMTLDRFISIDEVPIMWLSKE